MIKQLYSMYDAGNFNLCLQTALGNFNSRTKNKSAVMEIVLKIIQAHNQFLTLESIKTIYDFRRSYAEENTLASSFDEAVKEIFQGSFSVKIPAGQAEQAEQSGQAGQACFPAVSSTQASIYTIKIADTRSSSILKKLSPCENQLLDITGAALFSWINSRNNSEQKTLNLSVPTVPTVPTTPTTPATPAIASIAAIPIYWTPSYYTFIIEDSFQKEVNSKIHGDSMGIAMVTALFSVIFSLDMPLDIASTGIVKRDGSILPVCSIKEKLAAIKRERDYIKRVLISDAQTLPENPPDFEYIRIKHIQDIIENVFPDFVKLSKVSLLSSLIDAGSDIKSNIRIDLQNGINNIKRQYQDYLIDTCMDNCKLLISYIESEINRAGAANSYKKIRGTDRRIEHLFQCYWKLGACCCHKGNIGESAKYFETAEALYNQNRSIIEPKDYYNFQNNYAVLLKDIFCYQEAEQLHFKIDKELKAKELPQKYISENLSSLSQLYLAQHRYKEAESLQLKALEFIDSEDQHRNSGYLAQIYARAGDFDKAEQSLNEAQELIEQIIDDDVKSRQLDFYHWIESEYLYRFCTSISNVNQTLNRCYDRFCTLSKQYENITHFSHGLINKFCSLGILFFGEHERGLELLRKSEDFFDNQIEPMMKLLGVTVRIEKIAAWFQVMAEDRFCVTSIINSAIKQEVQKVIQGLSLQQNIRAFFDADIKRLEKYIEEPSDHTAHTLNSGFDNNFNNLSDILKSINKKIPY